MPYAAGRICIFFVTSSGLVSTEELFLDLMNLALDSADVKCLMLLPFHQVYGNGVEEKLAGFFKDKNEEERGKAVYFITEEPLSPVYCRLERCFILWRMHSASSLTSYKIRSI